MFHIKCLWEYQRKGIRPEECPNCRAVCFRYISEEGRPPSANQDEISVAVQPQATQTRHFLICPLCPRRRYTHRPNWEAHLRSAHQYCWLCPVELGNNYTITEHYLSHQPPIHYMCAQCSFPAASVNQLQVHVDYDHSFRSPRADCHCFDQALTLAQLAELGMNHYLCTICNHLSHRPIEFREHRREHQLFQCTRCQRRFSWQGLPQQHQCP